MRYVIVILYFILTLVATFMAFIISIASAKEGLAYSDMWIYGAVALALFIFIAIWIWIFRKFSPLFFKIIAGIGIFLVSFPLIIVLMTGGIFLYEGIQGKLHKGSVAVNDYKENLINWPSMPYPVGLRVEIDVPRKSLPNRRARYTPPMIWMGPVNAVPYDPYYYAYNPSNQLQPAVLRHLLFNKLNKNREPEIHPFGEIRKISADLYPGVIVYIESPQAFCTQEPSKGKGQRVYANGNQLNSQLFWHYSKEQVDASQFLTSLLRSKSQFEGNAELWTKMHQQFEDENLLKNGFHACTLESRRHCFCKTLN